MDITNPKVFVESGTPKTPRFYIPSLDGMRTFAFLIVFASHAGLGSIVPGGLGVTIFFFLSGYLITTLLRREYGKSGKINLKDFFIKRLLRIWPPYYVVLLLLIPFTYVASPDVGVTAESMKAFLAHSLHISNYFKIANGNMEIFVGSGLLWSLAVEEHFYLLFPFLYVLLLKLGIKPKGQSYVFGALCLLILIWRCILVFGLGADYFRTYYGTDTRLDGILFGCALAVNGNPMMDKEDQIPERMLKNFLVPLGITLILCTLFYRSDAFRSTFRYSIQGIALYPLFIAAIRFPNWSLFKPLNWAWVKFAGVLSYSLYLIHFAIILTLDSVFPDAGLLALAIPSLAISTALAYVIYRFIEVPMGKLKRKLTSH